MVKIRLLGEPSVDAELVHGMILFHVVGNLHKVGP